MYKKLLENKFTNIVGTPKWAKKKKESAMDELLMVKMILLQDMCKQSIINVIFFFSTAIWVLKKVVKC